MERQGNLVLVDAFAHIYRCFFAIPALTNARGEPVNAAYGMANFLFSLDRQLPHEFGAVAFDRGRPKERLELLPEYKANRPPTPPDLLAQLPLIRTWVEAAGWPILELDGHEADDLIATAVQAREGRPTYIVTTDKDLSQLVEPGVFWAPPGHKGKLDILGAEGVTERFGVPPAAVADYLTLIGDSSDNIPGVPGIGPKTAAALLLEFGSLDNLLAKLDTVSRPAWRDKLRDAGPVLMRNRQLVRLHPVQPPGWQGLAGLVRRPPDWDALLAVAADCGFKSLLATLERERQAARNPTLF